MRRINFYQEIICQEQTKEEQQLDFFLNRLVEINNLLKPLGSNIDVILDEEKEAGSLQKLKSNFEELKLKKELYMSFQEIEDSVSRVVFETRAAFTGIRNLLEQKPSHININKQDSQVQVSLMHSAAGIGSFALVNLFFQHGANPFLENCFHQTPAMRARKYANNPDLANHLECLEDSYDPSRSTFKR